MTRIVAQGISKRYTYRWILKDINCEFTAGKIYGIAGSNGTGKSTLIKILSGYLSPSSGKLQHFIGESPVHPENVYSHISLAGPYTDLVNEFTLPEMFDFHCRFKPFRTPVSYSEFEEKIELKGHGDKPLSHFSSGMKQKIQLSLGLLSNSPFLLLDEPSSFLDVQARNWFSGLLSEQSHGRVVVIASNDDYDLRHCDETLHLNQ